MPRTQDPDADLAPKILPAPLYRALSLIFEQGVVGCALVGGTALAGFYAGHRRSDDLDIFAKNESSHISAVLAVKNLVSHGARMIEQTASTRQYFRSVWELEGHHFTVDVVLDENLFRVGRFVNLPGKIVVPELETLLMTKAATLVSRCGEKDLYDLIWLFDKFPELDFGNLIGLGERIDGGMNGESVLISVTGARLSKSACDFSLNPKIGSNEIYKKIERFRRQLIKGITAHLRNQPTPPLGELVQKLERL